MPLSAFTDKSHQPEESELTEALGACGKVLTALAEHLGVKCPHASREWSYSGANYGWSLRYICKQRRIYYVIPQQNSFLFAIVLGNQAVEAVHAAGLPAKIIAAINSARRHAEGTGIRLPIKRRTAVAPLKQLIDIKLAN